MTRLLAIIADHDARFEWNTRIFESCQVLGSIFWPRVHQDGARTSTRLKYTESVLLACFMCEVNVGIAKRHFLLQGNEVEVLLSD